MDKKTSKASATIAALAIATGAVIGITACSTGSTTATHHAAPAASGPVKISAFIADLKKHGASIDYVLSPDDLSMSVNNGSGSYECTDYAAYGKFVIKVDGWQCATDSGAADTTTDAALLGGTS